MKENWKDIDGFEGVYQINPYGKVYSIKANRVLKTCISNRGYELVCLRDKFGKRKQYTVHRLVAKTFLPNPQDYPIVNHKDENKLNNFVENLEWCTYSYNNSYNGLKEKATIKISKKVYQYSLNWELINIYNSTRDVGRKLNVSYGNIGDACRNPELVRYGFHWSYDNQINPLKAR